MNINNEAVEAAARHLANLDPGDAWPTNEELGGHPMLGTRDDEYRHAMNEQANELLTAALPLLDADTLRQLPQVQALMAQAWEEGTDDMLAHCENPTRWPEIYNPHHPEVSA